ncbi:SDR family oxidoreductase [Staphylococcus aureus]|uniref:SDR family oxidoreductase n=1 Tax=Staphylococcus aureus TaxID=1280 RepID=UPI00338DD757
MNNKVLVTGGTGFVGMRIISRLLEQGYEVQTTIRDLSKADKVIKTMQDNGISTERLMFVEAALSQDEHWDEAMKDCKYVLSVASPVFFGKTDDAEVMAKPAIEGIQRILRAAEHAGVKRVVMTANFGAVGFSNKDKNSITNESHWTNEDEPGLSVYEKSKLLAEKAAWDFVENENTTVEFATINPVAIFGPSLDAHVSGSFHLLENLLNGSMKRVPQIPLNVVDVRDVAELHILAMTNEQANGKRFIATADGQINLLEIAKLIKEKRPEIAQKVSTKKLPDFVLSLGAKFNHQAKEGKLLLDMNRNVSNERAKILLGWEPIATQKEAILAAVDSMAKYHLI